MSDNKINKDFSFYPEKVIPIVKEQFQNEFNMLAELWKKEEKYDFTPLDAISNIENFRISFNEDPRFRQLIEYTISNNDDVRNALIEAGTIKTKLDTIPENEDNKRDPEPQPSEEVPEEVPEPKKKEFFKKALPYILTALGSFGLSYLLFNDDCDENSGRMIDGKSIKELTISECEEACNKRIEQIKDQIQDNVENIETGSLIED